MEIYMTTFITIIAVRYSREAEEERLQGAKSAAGAKAKANRSHSEAVEKNYRGKDPNFSGCISVCRDYHSVSCPASLVELVYLGS